MRQILKQYIARSIKKSWIRPHSTCSHQNFSKLEIFSTLLVISHVLLGNPFKCLYIYYIKVQTLNWLTLNQMTIINYLLLVVSPRIIKLVCCKIKLNKTSLLSYSQAVLISFRISETLMMLKIESSGRDQQICGLAIRHLHFWDEKILI